MYLNIDYAIRIVIFMLTVNCLTKLSFSYLKQVKTYLSSQQEKILNSLNNHVYNWAQTASDN